MDWGYFPSALIFAGLIAAVAVAYYVFKADEVLTFWLAYILTRPLGASVADWMIHSKRKGGLGWGTTHVNGVFFALILVLVGYLAVSKKDAPPEAGSAS